MSMVERNNNAGAPELCEAVLVWTVRNNGEHG